MPWLRHRQKTELPLASQSPKRWERHSRLLFEKEAKIGRSSRRLWRLRASANDRATTVGLDSFAGTSSRSANPIPVRPAVASSLPSSKGPEELGICVGADSVP